MKRVLKLHPYFAILWAGIIVLSIAFSTHSIAVKNNIQTDLLALLPSQKNSLLQEAQSSLCP